MTASLLCAVHCALMPLVITLLPLIGLAFLANEWVEWLLLGASGALGVSSLCLGYRAHGRRRPLAVLATGLALVALGRAAHAGHWRPYDVTLLVVGGFTIATSHYLNRRLCRSCHACGDAEADAACRL